MATAGAQPAQSLGDRASVVQRLSSEQFDVVVVGGGITGAGIALDCVARGLKVALVDKSDFAIGTSSRSTKLVHGGLRYLAQYQFKVTHEALTERYVLEQLAPGLVEWTPFVLPMYGSILEMGKVGIGLIMYDTLAGMRTPNPHRRVSKDELLEMAPGIGQEKLLGAYVYSDCRTDDVRLTIEVLKTAAARGAAIVNHCEVTGFVKVAGKARGVTVRDRRSGADLTVKAHHVVLATGVWVDNLLRLDDPNAPRCVRPAKGVHLVVERARFGFDVALFLPTAPDGRLVFVVPWQDSTLIGTTDTDYDESIDEPLATLEDCQYLLTSTNNAFPDAHLGLDDIVSVQAGLRPLVSAGGGSTTKISREDRIFETASGVVAIAGGKLTTYRKMAERATDLLAKRCVEDGQLSAVPVCATDRIGIGAFAPGPTPAADFGTLPADVVDHLRKRYGQAAGEVAAIAAERPELAERIVPALPNLLAEIAFAARTELAQTLADVLVRRTHIAQLTRDQGRSVARRVAGVLARELGWSSEAVTRELAALEVELKQYTPPS